MRTENRVLTGLLVTIKVGNILADSTFEKKITLKLIHMNTHYSQ